MPMAAMDMQCTCHGNARDSSRDARGGLPTNWGHGTIMFVDLYPHVFGQKGDRPFCFKREGGVISRGANAVRYLHNKFQMAF